MKQRNWDRHGRGGAGVGLAVSSRVIRADLKEAWHVYRNLKEMRELTLVIFGRGISSRRRELQVQRP
jgi:hypothetical protein